jgi:hypothetical protein
MALKEIINIVKLLDESTKNQLPYNVSDVTIVATPTKPATKDIIATVSSPGYQRVRINTDINRNGRQVYVCNDGPGAAFVLYAPNTIEWSPDEISIEDGRYIILNNVFEVRIRSVLLGCNFTVTEYPRATPQDVTKAEKIEILSTDKDTDFTGAIIMNDHETANITGFAGNKYMIRGVNIQSDQALKYRLIFWGSDTFNSTDLDADTYIDDVELDLTTSPAFRINNTGQYYLNVGDLQIIYEDYDATRELHISLQNQSATTKNAGVSGEVQIDIKTSPRL